MKPRIRMLGAGLLVLAAAACAPQVDNHGFMPPEEALERIRVGQDTRETVQRKIGRPSSSSLFTETGWYYVATTIERFAFYEPEVVDRRVVAIEFDERDRVASVNRYGLEDGKVIDLETRTTPTHGRQVTIVEQLLGNIGNLQGGQLFGDE